MSSWTNAGGSGRSKQGKTEEECKRMWRLGCHEDVAAWRAENGIALADWRAANGIAADFDAMHM